MEVLEFVFDAFGGLGAGDAGYEAGGGAEGEIFSGD